MRDLGPICAASGTRSPSCTIAPTVASGLHAYAVGAYGFSATEEIGAPREQPRLLWTPSLSDYGAW
jgi:hypothetical protein